MKHISIGHNKLAQLLAFATVLLFSTVGTTHARGYGSGGGEGQNHSYYISNEEAKFFAVYDFNRNGYIDPEEVAFMGMPARIFNQTDSDKNGKLDKGEFSKMWTGSPK